MADLERRKYIRINSVLPVELYLTDSQGKRTTPWLQGFTRDIGKGGICLFINDLWPGFFEKFSGSGLNLSLRIDLGFKHKPLVFKAKVVWTKQEKLDEFCQYLFGLEFDQEQSRLNNELFAYAVFKKVTPYAVGAILCLFIIITSFLFLKARVLSYQNRSLVRDHVAILLKDSFLENNIKNKQFIEGYVNKRMKELEEAVALIDSEIKERESWYQSTLKDDKNSSLALQLGKELDILKQQSKAITAEEQFLRLRAKNLLKDLPDMQEESKEVKKDKLKSSQKVISGLYDWIENRQNLSSGLILSYEGDNSLERVCFTYDQALAAFVFLLKEDNSRAKKVLDFYLGRINMGQKIYNAYYAQGDVFEYTVHSGPNAWIGLAALDYVKRTGEKKYLALADAAASLILSLQDSQGGIKGGPQHNWYSTEHNLDAFSFLRLYYELSKDKKYLEASDKIKNWIALNAYSKSGLPVKRGKGDSTIATDTYAWSVTALGPELLYSLDMNPEAILEFARQNCEVKVKFKRDEGEITLQGFDFAKVKNSARGGVVSGEWTSQMILAYEVMADYYLDKDPDKSKAYLNKARFYFNELQKMIITSLSRAGKEDPCLPYASKDFIDTGHGWRTPKGKMTGSLSSTAYFLLCFEGYNPLKAKVLGVSLKNGLDSL
ncbi:MAG: PilZ domain-containing protein [Candidatus Omnitrophica bacterium]|nr:PilZ domain-containing protein [Candidatus Omnitrophota bacterium]